MAADRVRTAGAGTATGRTGGASRAALLAALCGLTFYQGNVSMGYQLVGSRLLYPYFGSTIYVWAVLISTFLLAFSLGSFLGGHVSQASGRRRRRLVLGVSLAGVAGFAVTALLGRTLLASLDPSPEGQMLSLSLACGALFLVPVCATSALSPLLADLASRLGLAAGQASGLVYGVSTAGNIAGILLTVFVLIPGYPVSTILLLWLAAAALLYGGFRLLDAALDRGRAAGAAP